MKPKSQKTSMMKSAIEWLMGKTDESLNINEDLNPVPAIIGPELEVSSADKDSSKEIGTLVNGHLTGGNHGFPLSNSVTIRRPTGEEIISPWGRTLTPKSQKFASFTGPKIYPQPSKLNSSHANSKRIIPSSISWEEMSFTCDIMSPGFATRIAKEAKGIRKRHDGIRKYPIGQEKYIRSGVLPNVRLKGRSKPVVMARRTTTAPLVPLASSSTSPFSSSSLASGFLATASTRMPDISSVVSVLESTSPSSASDSISDPTSVQAVVAALEQAQNLKSGIKRSRYVENEDSGKKQKCVISSNLASSDSITNVSSPILSQAFNNGGGGEKRALDLSPPSAGAEAGTPERPQLSPENKRRCIPDPRIASLSSSKNIATPSPMLNQISGRETPFSIYESHQDSDSESNKSLDSHQSRLSERSYKGQSHESPFGRVSNQDQFDRSGSQTPQSLRGSYGIGGGGASNGSNSSSRTTTPSRPSHAFSLEAYKADKAKSHQRLNKMLGMLFNVAADDVQVVNQPVISDAPTTTSEASVSVTTSTTEICSQESAPSSAPIPSGLLKEAFNSIQPDLPTTTEENLVENAPVSEESEVSSTFTFTLKTKQNEVSETKEIEECSSEATTKDININFAPPPYSKPLMSESTSHSSASALTTSSSVPSTYVVSGQATPIFTSTSIISGQTSPTFTFDKPVSSLPSKDTSSTAPTSLSFPTLSFSSPTSLASNPLEALKSTALSAVKSPSFTFGPGQSSSTLAVTTSSLPLFSFGKPNVTSTEATTTTTSGCSQNSVVFSILPNTVSTISETSRSVVSTSSMKPIFSLGAQPENTSIKVETAISSSSEKDTKPTALGGMFPQLLTSSTSTLAGNKVPPNSSSALFSFAVSSSSSVIPQGKLTDQMKSSMYLPFSSFSFGKSISCTSEASKPDNSVAPVSSIFSFGSSQAEIPSSNTFVSIASPQLPSVTAAKLPSSTDTRFTLTPSLSVANMSSVVSTSSSTFGGSIFSFGSNSTKSSLALSALPTTGVSSSSGLFTFGEANKTVTQSSATPFQFSTDKTATQSNVAPFHFGTDKQATQPSAAPFQFATEKPATQPSAAPFQFATEKPATQPSAAPFQFATEKPATQPSATPFQFATEKPATQLSATPFQFGTVATSSSDPVPVFGSTVGGGFSFGGTKVSSPSVIQFGATSSTNSNSNTFSFNAPSPNQNTGFQFSTPKTSTTSGIGGPSSGMFTFGNNASPFGTPTTSSGTGFGSSTIPRLDHPPSLSLNFISDNKVPVASPFGGQSSAPAPPFGSLGMGSKAPSKSLFGGGETAATPAFGSANSSSPFGSGQNPFNVASKSQTPAFGAFGGAKLTESPAPTLNQNPFQMGQTTNQSSSTFAFGKPNPNPQPGVFMFGSQGTQSTTSSAPASSTFGGGFNFGGAMPGGGTNLFTLGAAPDTSSAPRRPKARAHRRK